MQRSWFSEISNNRVCLVLSLYWKQTVCMRNIIRLQPGEIALDNITFLFCHCCACTHNVCLAMNLNSGRVHNVKVSR